MNIDSRKIKEIVCQAHMAGQMDAGCKEPSWSEAHAYYVNNVKEVLKENLCNMCTKYETCEYKTIKNCIVGKTIICANFVA